MTLEQEFQNMISVANQHVMLTTYDLKFWTLWEFYKQNTAGNLTVHYASDLHTSDFRFTLCTMGSIFIKKAKLVQLRI